ncbi:uncharacterized protein FIBRA_08140 [Fibroporia radiculosa]|uniref:Uncharacterized protein n=1 Tax=Fibroporia radiculosa TaxID=599839 RepID=J4I292_9APHY|nr:uncharacterized protein FIBRA_08140 [Fibroporia radiculosa]CCM05902.1 predicted protein [Fibroporia radiculosa]
MNVAFRILRRHSTTTSSRPLASIAAPHGLGSGDHALLLRRVFRISQRYGRKSNDSIFNLLNALARNPLSAVPEHYMHRSRVTAAELVQWRPVLIAPTIGVAMKRMENLGVIIPSLDILAGPKRTPVVSLLQPPSWLVLYLLCYKVVRPDETKAALSLAYYHFPAAPPHLQAALLIFSAGWFAEHDLTALLLRVVMTFLDVSSGIEKAYQFQTLLQILGYASFSKDASVVVARILDAAEQKLIALDQNTYDVLLGSRTATSFVGVSVMRHMHTHGYQATVKHLTRLLDLFSAHRWKRRARLCYRLLRENYGVDLQSLPAEETSSEDARLYIKSQNRYVSTFEFARILPSHPQTHASSAPNRLHRGRRRQSYSASFLVPKAERKSSRSSSMQKSVEQLAATKLKYTRIWRFALHSATKNPKTTGKHVLHTLHRARAMNPFLRSDATLHLLALRGLIRRQDYQNALLVWGELACRKTRLPRWVMTVGIEVLTLSGHANRAFQLLQKAADNRIGLAAKLSRSQARRLRILDLVNTRIVNVFMASLQRAGYSDLVFELWHNMEILFGVRPDCFSLTILLQTARFASSHSNPSLRGALTEFGLGGLLPRPATTLLSPEAIRQQLFSHFSKALDASNPTLNTGLWGSERAGTVALRIIHEVLFTNSPDLEMVPSPARAIRPSADFQALSPVADLFRSVSRQSVDVQGVSKDIAGRTASSLSAHIIPNDALFYAYINLLATESRIPQIPLALAWMRHLGIRPSERTLASALVHWAEVSMDAPLVQQLKGGRSEYQKLTKWMRGWVGEQHMPTDEQIGTELQQLKSFRELRLRKTRQQSVCA